MFISNVPEELSSSAGMPKAGCSCGFVFGFWAAMAAATTVPAVLGYSVIDPSHPL
ncbi:hypothetical protein ACFVTC_40075 [Streptomyces sp. NPDC057950]|uniref:hypothetical protein n=1 Tax=Streptomyces sp. NPDC057950 TaxID=3346288 RepID=UPI0036EAABA4